MTRLISIVFFSLAMLSCAASKPDTRSDEASKDQSSTESWVDRAGTTQHTSRKPGEAKVAASPSALLEKGAAKKVQAALQEKGYPVKKTGVVDARTKSALRHFQRQEKIAATGMPDQLTLQHLDLDPKEILGGYATSKKGELERQK